MVKSTRVALAGDLLREGTRSGPAGEGDSS